MTVTCCLLLALNTDDASELRRAMFTKEKSPLFFLFFFLKVPYRQPAIDSL